MRKYDPPPLPAMLPLVMRELRDKTVSTACVSAMTSMARESQTPVWLTCVTSWATAVGDVV